MLFMKTPFLIIFALLSGLCSFAQTPSSCFEIESILVDACGNPEGENEMVKFRVGPAPLNVSSLNVNWPNNGWLGVCQNATTSGKVAQLNATIQSCGWLLEPTGGVLPAGSQVILVSSTNFSVSANSFAGLSDTVYIIFQCSGNTAGHFANATGSGTRTLSMTFSSPSGCSDNVSYNCQSLTDVNGNTGTSGPSALRDGATVEFSWPGTATYTNDGCNAPFQPQTVDAGQGGTVCPGDTVQLLGSLTGSFSSFSWSGGTGVYLNGSTLSPQYVVGAGDNGLVPVVLSAINCNGSVSDTMFLNIGGGSSVTVTPVGPVSLCQGSSQLLTASGTGPFVWSTGQTGASITVTTPGIYHVIASGSCGADTAFVTVNVTNLPSVNITQSGNVVICSGTQATLNATGSGTIQWSTGQTGPGISTGTAGMIYATVTNSCGTAIDSVQITTSNTAAVQISPSGPLSLCSGDSIQLTANGSGTFSWNTGETAASIYVSAAGTYIVNLISACGTAADTVIVSNNGQAPAAQIIPAGPTGLCSGQVLNLTASGGGNYSWNTGQTTAGITVSNPGTYSVIVSNACGSDTAFVTITADTAPSVTIDQGTDSTICSGQTMTLSATGNGALTWSGGQTGSSIQVSTAGSYYVVNTNGCGTDTAFFTVSVSTVTAQFTADPYSGQVPLMVQFDNTSTGAVTYGWTFGDGETSSLSEPSHLFESPGDFLVILTATNSDGCQDTASALISVDSCMYTAYLPNTFTPNNDGINDEYFIKGECIRFIQVYIYNRWGAEVYSWEDINGTWKGQSHTDAAVPEGTYVYVADVLDYNGKDHHYTGMITLVR